MNIYNVIFLDIDGVMNSVQYDCWRHNHHIRKYGSIDPRECHRMARFCEKYNIKLVISSSWRNGNSCEKTIQEFMNDGLGKSQFNHYGIQLLCPYIVGVTPYCKSRIRGREVEAFFEILDGKHPDYKKCAKEDFKIGGWCMVDDDNDMLDNQLDHFVQTSYISGITKKDYKKILKIIFKDEYKKCIEDFNYFKKYLEYEQRNYK